MSATLRMITRKMSTDNSIIKRVTVIGGGLMGAGIAQVNIDDDLKKIH